MLTKLTRGNQLTIPRAIVQSLKLKAGIDYFEVGQTHGVIYLKPVDIEERLSPEDFERFQREVLKVQKGDHLVEAKDAENFLAKRQKGKR